MSELTRNPDILTCLANLSNDEVFTPPEVANAMLDLIPEDFWKDPNVRVFDPACKTGVFLREAAKRFLKGEEDAIPDIQERIDHIFHKQLFGYAITELTSHLSRRTVYCSKTANGKYSVTPFKSEKGNIAFSRIEHTWEEGKCKCCGASQEVYDRGDAAETYAYKFIHLSSQQIRELQDMKFDLIIGNPPYQLDDGGNGKSAKPIYHLFVQQAMKLKPRYLTMIIPSRWFVGGKGLDDFRSSMLRDSHIRTLVDYENFRDVFPGVDLAGGACYFLWDRDTPGKCKVVNKSTNFSSESIRKLDEFDTFIRNNSAVDIVKKIIKWNSSKPTLESRVSSRKPFGLPSNYLPADNGIPCWFIQRIGLKFANKADVSDNNGYLKKWKFLIPAAPIAGQTDFSKPVGFFYDGNTRISKPGECCTETWLVAGAFDTKEETENYKSYLFTKTVRFLLLQNVVSQHISTKSFSFIPDLGKYNELYTDEKLKAMWGITEDEWGVIDSRIGEIEGR